MIREQQLVPIQPWKTLLIGHFSISAIPSQHTPPTAVNNDLGQEIAHPLPLPVRFSEFKEGHSFDYLIEYHSCRIWSKPVPALAPISSRTSAPMFYF
ncbi:MULTISPECIES: hypothetical protein [Acinetobacter]|uniref:Uncharacterized protein n=1 Tax=Acinetobacter entericus TaxID=2989714 RepID=A0ABT3NL45_9GAMM|nr:MULTISPECIES: hypothetical protein [Acinetobacter]MCW8040280.1 hypothetical protein [Acinetobacter entericus]